MVEPTPIQTINMDGIRVWVKREDLNHAVIQGNKLRKLKYNILAAKQQSAQTLVTFGGAYSNHLLATAYAAHEAGFQSLGMVRGDELAAHPEKWSETLKQCQHYGMQLEFVSRRDYRLKQHSESFKQRWTETKQPFLIPEGGSNHLAVKGMAELVSELNHQLPSVPDHVFCPVGTGGTLAGLIAGANRNKWQCKIFGTVVLKGLRDVKNDINHWLKGYELTDSDCQWSLLTDFHGGGYGRLTPEMADFGRQFSQQNKFPLDKVYNVKSFYAMADFIKRQKLTNDNRLLIIHTGGLQGGML